MVSEGTVNGVFEDTKVQFLEAATASPIEKPAEFAGIRIASMPNLMAMKLIVIQDRGELRDYFDIMVMEQKGGIPVDAGLKMLIDRYRPRSPDSVIAGVIRGLGYLGDVENDPSVPMSRKEIESFWHERQTELLRKLD